MKPQDPALRSIMERTKRAARRRAILAAASQVFLECGFERASMSMICDRLGVSKATLYHYFTSKEELFYEIVAASTDADFESVRHALVPPDGDMAESLCRLGEALLHFLYSPPVMAHRRLFIAESGRTEMGSIVYERAVRRIQHRISDFLRSAMRRGTLKLADPGRAAMHLCGLLESELIYPYLYRQPVDTGPDAITAMTERAVAVFLAAYDRGG